MLGITFLKPKTVAHNIYVAVDVMYDKVFIPTSNKKKQRN
jgi:hypothetical protein